MKPSEFKKVITLLRDCENKIDFIVHLYDLVEPETVAEPDKELEKAEKKAQKEKKAPAEEKPKGEGYAVKQCKVCGKEFKPNRGAQTTCDECKKKRPIKKSEKKKDDQETLLKKTAAELAAMTK